jgi:photosystem II stability/assembly factor-like uncharacterized protein
VGGGATALYTVDGGVEWAHAAMPIGAGKKFRSVFFIDRNKGWISGDNGQIYFTDNGGQKWKEQISPVTVDLLDVFFIDHNEGFAAGEEGVILRTNTAGKRWSIEETNTKYKLESLFFIGKRGFAVGFGGTILRYDPDK